MKHKNPQRSDMTRERILRAAEAVFLSKGFRAASMEEIAFLSSISSPHIYNFFKNKAELALAVHNVMHAKLKKQMTDFVEAGNGDAANMEALAGIFDRRKIILMLTLLTEATINTTVRETLVRNLREIEALLMDSHDINPNDEERRMRTEMIISFYIGCSVKQLLMPTTDEDAMKKVLSKVSEWLARKRPADGFAEIEAPAK